MKLSLTNTRLLHQQTLLARANQAAAMAAVVKFQRDLESQFGIPIQIKKSPQGHEGDAFAKPMWESARPVNYHVIYTKACDESSRPHVLAHELTHIALESEAQAVGRRMTRCIWGTQVKNILDRCQPRREGDRNLVQQLFHSTGNLITDIVVETRLRRQFPILAPAQFLRFQKTALHDGELQFPAEHYSQHIVHAVKALCGARALFHDHLNGDRTNHFLPFLFSPAGSLAKQLCNEVTTAIEALGPGDHYALINHVEELVGFPGLTSWDPRPAWELAAQYAGQEMNL